MEVGLRSACPSSACTVGRSAPPSTKCVAKLCLSRVRAHGFGDTRSLRRFPAGFPKDFGRDRFVGTGTVDGAGKQVSLRLHPAPVFTQGLERLWAQWYVAVLAAFALADVDQQRVLSMSSTLRRHSSARRMPVE